MLKCPIGSHDKKWAPNIACKHCVKHLNEWIRGKRASGVPFAVPMVWREQKDHSSDCYFCLTNTKGYSVKTRFKIKYPDVPSAHRPVPHSPDLPVPKPPLSSQSESESSEDGECMDTDFQDVESKEPHLISQVELHDLVKDLYLPKEKN